MSIQWNKVTWYSKVLAVVLALLIFYIGFKLGEMKRDVGAVPAMPHPTTPAKTNAVSITTKTIKEENFTGKVAVVSGESPIAKAAQAYIDKSVADFRKQADTDVPDMRKQFGADSPTANYEIDIDAKQAAGPKTESIVLDTYVYTGGAHGSSSYKVYTASRATGEMLSLSDVIQTDQQAAFTNFVKKELNAWQPAGSTAPVVFPEDVGSLKFDSFTDWSLDEKNLTLYFSQYEIGPGVLGEVAFPLPLSKVKDFLNPAFNEY